MRVRVLDAVQRCKKEIEDRALEAPFVPPVDEVEAVPREHQLVLNPQDSYPPIQNVW